MSAAIKAVAGTVDLLEGPLAEDPAGVAEKFSLAGAPVIFGGQIVGSLKGAREGPDKKARWQQIQLDRSSQYFEAIKDRAARDGLTLALASGSEMRSAGFAIKAVALILKPTAGGCGRCASKAASIPATAPSRPTPTAPASKGVGYKIVDAEEVSDFHRYLIRTRGSSLQEKLHINQPVTFHFVRLAKSWESPDTYATDAPDVWGFTADRDDGSGQHHIYIRADLTDEQVEATIPHEMAHVKQLQDGRMSEPHSVLEQEADEYADSFVYDYNHR